MRADRLLSENIAHLLRKRGQTQKSLAEWCGHSEKWLSSILGGERQLRALDFDRVADFFGIAVYQLFQPGISPLTERRSGKDRRDGKDRRISASVRQMMAVRDNVDVARSRKPPPPPHIAHDGDGTG